jgi:broad specificity phosphatase PhoE
MTTIYLVRHAVHDLVTRVLVGRSEKVTLSATGFRQAQRLARHFAEKMIARVQSSPQPRARQTAQPIAALHGLPVEVVPDLDELDMGAWTGGAFQKLRDDPLWHRWNTQRERARPPAGESMSELQKRAVAHLRRVAADGRDCEVVMVTHAEAIRAVVLHCLDRSLDDFGRVTVDPASVTTIRVQPKGGDVVALNMCLQDGAAA